jgi:hypothetical protein
MNRTLLATLALFLLMQCIQPVFCHALNHPAGKQEQLTFTIATLYMDKLTFTND